MVQIITINKFVNSRNQFLFRLPIYTRKIGDRQYSNQFSNLTTDAGDEHRKRILFNRFHSVNNVSHRYSSSSGDGKAPVFKFSELKTLKKKVKDSRRSTLRTAVAEVLKNSSSLKQESVGLIRKNSLKKFIFEPTANKPKTESCTVDRPRSTMVNEKPVLFTPQDFVFDAQKNKALIDNLPKSLEEFLLKNSAESIPMVNSAATATATTEDKLVSAKLKKKIQPDGFRMQESLTDSLRAYINACVTVGLLERAFSVLNEYRRKTLKRNKLKFDYSELFVELMAKYATDKNKQRVNQIYCILLEERVSITPQVYMLMLSCFSRCPGNNKMIKKCIEMAAEKNISINDIMDKSTFSGDQRSFVLEAIRLHKPDFVPVYTPPNVEYNNKLLNFMNRSIRNIEEEPHQLIEDADMCKISKSKSDFDPEQLERFANEQLASENDGHVVVKNIQMLDPNILSNAQVKKSRKMLDQLFIQWREEIKATLNQRLQILHHKMRTTSTRQMNIYPYLILLTHDELTDILLDQIKDLAQGSGLFSSTVVQVYSNIGKKVLRKHQVHLQVQSGVNDKINELYKTYSKILCSGQCSENPRQLWQRIVHQSRGHGPCLSQKSIRWPWAVETSIGRTLFTMLADNIKINANILHPNEPQDIVRVVYSVFLNRDLRSREEIRMHPAFTELCREAKFDTFKFNSNEIPMLCPPVPWTTIDSGGYLISHSDLVRLPYDFRKQIDMIRKAPPRQLYPPLDTLNQLGSIPWQINTRILDLAIQVFNSGGNEQLNVPLTPDSRLTDDQLNRLGLTGEELAQRKKSAGYGYMQAQRDLFSLYSDTMYKLSLANHFRDRPFWLPHNMDFRGRTYPIPPHLTHLSADLTRSLLQFHQKRPLGASGLDWLKLHCINLTGLMKRGSIQDRLLYAENVFDDIIDSADNPLDGNKWWLNSDEPWQTLAACMEIANAIRSPDPTTYMSSFPIHQDGSCNGLQHYAALGRDVDGAASVNLAPAQVPQDVYTTILLRVEKWRKRDAEAGNETALALEGLIKRKTIKQTVMTTVYGVTRYGARLQIKKQLKDMNFNSKLVDKAATYVAAATFGSLSETFKSAREIQDWFTKCASAISKHNQEHVEWVSPLGLPIIQPYTHPVAHKSSDSLTKLQAEGRLNSMKEKNAFSPNFIHSLDSCHMMLTALNCERAGVTFVSVHDCFWTHANTVPIMSRICREQFVLLHSQPILENLGDGFYQKFKNVERSEKKKVRADDTNKIEGRDAQMDLFRAIPEKGEFDLKKVLESVYFFS